jgi:hypothetical protein
MRRLGGRSGEQAVYDTSKNFEEIVGDKEKADMSKFDELLGGDDSFQ